MNPRVAVAQMNCALGNVRHNLQKIKTLAQRAARREVDMVCFPELATTGYALNRSWRKLAEIIPGPSSDALGRIASEHGFYLICGFDELDSKSKRIHDSSALFDSNGDIVGVYRKVHLWANEQKYFTPGDSFPTFRTRFGRIGLGICYDLEFPEPARIMALGGADIVFFSSAQPKPMQAMVDTYVRSRAGENSVFACHSNRVGREGRLVYFGQSQIVSPTCQPLARMSESEGLIQAELDLPSIKKLRKTELPYFRDRTPNLYSALGKKNQSDYRRL
ncbi:MAG: carbon-nitrogen hydrolase family protein [Candidatus Bathyarchaeia archaeon]